MNNKARLRRWHEAKHGKTGKCDAPYSDCIHYGDGSCVGCDDYKDIIAKMTEEEKQEEYKTLIAGGLSEYEARGTIWPEPELGIGDCAILPTSEIKQAGEEVAEAKRLAKIYGYELIESKDLAYIVGYLSAAKNQFKSPVDDLDKLPEVLNRLRVISGLRGVE